MPTDTPWGQQAGIYHAREDRRMLSRLPVQAGIAGYGQFYVGVGSGLTVNVTPGEAWVQGSHSGVSRQGLYPVGLGAQENGVVVPAAHATLPRIDQVVLRVRDTAPAPAAAGDAENTGKLEVVQGVATSGATLANRSGAATLPASSLRLADLLVPAAFAGPFVQNTHIRQRQPHAYGAGASWGQTNNTFGVTNEVWTALWTPERFEFSRALVPVSAPTHALVRLRYSGSHAGTGFSGWFRFRPMVDGAAASVWEINTGSIVALSSTDGTAVWTPAAQVHAVLEWDLAVPIGSRTIGLDIKSDTGFSTTSVLASTINPRMISIREHMGPVANNAGA